jgi:tRNA (guanine37-N1)-methyltransferase
LEAGHFTRPREYRGLTVPEVLLGGDHEAIARWREEQSRELTGQRRKDLLGWEGVERENPDKSS